MADLTHAEKRAELKKWLAAAKDRREKKIALKIFRKRHEPKYYTFKIDFDNAESAFEKFIKRLSGDQ